MFTPQAISGAHVRTAILEPGASRAEILRAVAGEPSPAALESARRHELYGRYSLYACRPLEVLTLAGGVLRNAAGAALADGVGVWPALEAALEAVKLQGPRGGPYGPGWIGYVGYEVGRLIERLPEAAVRDTSLPDLRLAFHDAVLVHDAADDSWRLEELAFDAPPPGAGEAAEALRAAVEGRLNAPPPDTDCRPCDEPASNFTPEQYRRAVRRCLEYIAAGDIFQVNLSQRFEAASPPPLRLYERLREANPAWHAAYLGFETSGGPCAVASSSPELFLRVRGRQVTTRPIKGTRRRGADAAADAEAARQLQASEKDAAELAMIVDLLRNDLGRVCEYGSVRVARAGDLEEHPTVHHRTATVTGRLRAGVGPAALLRATFPGGSVTGAPKIRAMEIIDELEPVARGVYTGCIGWVGLGGDAEWNIAIRTVVCDGRRALVQAGGGIVADSDPAAEYAETLDKARALLEAIRRSC